MKRKPSRKRSLYLIGLIPVAWQGISAAIPPFRQHPLRPARRLVHYKHDYNETDVEAFQESTSSLNPVLAVDSDIAHGSIWHVHADARAGVNVDALFENLWQRYKVKQSPASFDSENSFRLLRSTVQNTLSRSSLVSSWFNLLRQLTVKKSAATSSFVQDSDIAPVPNEGDEQSEGQEVSTGFNVTADTEYNVSASVEYDNNRNSSNGESPLSTNDTSTVVYTSAQPCNSSCFGVDSLGNNYTFVNNNTATSNETAEADDFQPLHIRAFLSEIAGGGEHLTVNERSELLQQMVRPALLAWSAALRVRPVKGNLTVDASQLHDGRYCGPHNDQLPSVAVPYQHLTEGVMNSDMIVYIGLSFTDAGIDYDASDDVDGDSNSTYSSSYLSNFRNNETVATEPMQGNKLKQELVKAVDTLKNESGCNNTRLKKKSLRPKQKCAGDYMAASTFCSTDQFDRPTAALLHICIDQTFFDPSNLATNIRVMMHEIGHALGFNSISMAHFRRSDGSPITKRLETGEIPLSLIDCTGPVTRTDPRKGLVPLPSEEILQFRTVRNGIHVAEIVTPNVAQVVQNHFDCHSLPGAELESGEFLPLSTNPGEITCLGDHWERRLFQNDLMNPIVDMDSSGFNPRFSTLTLAFFADSGWYKADLSRANYPSIWGRGAGCAFVEQPCISANGTVAPSNEPYFCTEKPKEGDDMNSEYSAVIQGCTPDLSRKASCSLGRYAGDLPQQYQYFRNNYGAEFGGSDPFMDYCPVYAGFANGLCSDSENEALIRVSKVERFGSRNSRCLSSRVSKQSIATSSGATAGSSIQEEVTGLCMPIACVVDDRSLRIQVSGKWKTCTEKDERLVAELHDDSVTITCPDPIRICPTFYCQRDCLGRSDGRSICDYSIGECVCAGTEVVIGPDNTTSCVADLGVVLTNSTFNETIDKDFQTTKADLFFDSKQDKGQLPDPDSPLADYYVSTARNLKEEDDRLFKDPWFWGVLMTLVLFLSLILYYVLWFKKGTTTGIDSSPRSDDLDGGSTINPDKHKMMATVVVNLRMNDPTLQRRVDALQDTASETDLSMTDTEGSAYNPNDVSIELTSLSQEDTCDDMQVNIDQTDINSTDSSIYGIDPLAHSPPVKPVVRRRHLPFVGNECSHKLT